MKTFKFYLEPSAQGNYTFRPNEIVNGAVELILTENEKFKACHINVYGAVHTFWIEYNASTSILGFNTINEMQYKGKEVYLNSKSYFFGSDQDEILKSFNAGHYKYKFSYQLPRELPSTVRTKYGRIFYFIEAVLTSEIDENRIIYFDVSRIDDLNSNYELKLPQTLENAYQLNYGFGIKTKPLTLVASIPCSGFAAGQQIPIHIKLSNPFERKYFVEKTKVKFYRKITFKSNEFEEKAKIITEDLVVKYFEGVAENSTIEYQCYLDIPMELPNSNKQHCDVIKIEYFLNVDARANKSFMPEVTFPIEIGTIRLRSGDGFDVIDGNIVLKNAAVRTVQSLASTEENASRNESKITQPLNYNLPWNTQSMTSQPQTATKVSDLPSCFFDDLD